VASESGLGLGGGANFFGFPGAGLGLAAAQNFASDQASYRRPESGFATQLEGGPVEFIEIERGIGVNDDGRLAGGGEELLQGFVPIVPIVPVVLIRFVFPAVLVLFNRRSVGNGEVVVGALEVARKAFVEHDEFRSKFRTMGMGSGILWPIGGDLPRKGGVAGKDQNGRAIHAYRCFLIPTYSCRDG